MISKLSCYVTISPSPVLLYLLHVYGATVLSHAIEMPVDVTFVSAEPARHISGTVLHVQSMHSLQTSKRCGSVPFYRAIDANPEQNAVLQVNDALCIVCTGVICAA